jgi:hypothetical protein
VGHPPVGRWWSCRWWVTHQGNVWVVAHHGGGGGSPTSGVVVVADHPLKVKVFAVVDTFTVARYLQHHWWWTVPATTPLLDSAVVCICTQDAIVPTLSDYPAIQSGCGGPVLLLSSDRAVAGQEQRGNIRLPTRRPTTLVL